MSWPERRLEPERLALRLNNLPHKIEALKAGHDTAHFFCFLAEREPGLFRLTEPEPLSDTGFWPLRYPDLRQVARVRAVLDFIVQCTTADPLLQGGPLARETRTASSPPRHMTTPNRHDPTETPL